ncbi:Protein tesmin/TSO1-like CXC 2 [Dichanthelium oligosanthes]|uniref:Protein tesmin/TSO1-like CXC 2 n=1 Tax=Dichanthelium oligosanthes TaxID=888268 RepID=A0A1E5VUY1_9POAL|nr:Protein tesmin/TSO1-like CXC 2 [Dichanthelium oligosanthes]
MDTPDRAAAQPAASRAEDSPVFSFINNLSPIEPLKSVYNTNSLQGYQSINITSISSIFTSPHDNVHKEPRLPKSSLGEISESEVCADGSNTNKPTKSSNAVRLFACTSTVTQETHTVTCSDVVDPATGSCDLAQPAQFDNGSPDHNTTPCHGVRSDLKQDKCRKLDVVQTVKNTVEKRKCLFSTEIQLMDGGLSVNDNDEVLGCEWADLISTTSGELLAFDSTMDEHHRGVHLAAKNAESCGYLLSKLTGDGEISDRAPPSASGQVYYQELMMGEDQTENAEMFQDGQQTISTEEIQDNIYEANGCIPLDYKVESQQRGIRRRCLVFEAAGFSNSVVQKETVENLSVSKSKGKSHVQTQPRGLRGIGLHLNALALTPKGKMACLDTMASALLPSSASEKDAHVKLLSAGESFPHSGGELLEFPMDDCSAGDFPVNDHVSSQSVSPQKKRRKTDNGDDGEACKRCSCKKSKCLKLYVYCECFAAGVYCSEPCSCQGCMNKPIHEETVLSTRKQIEFRNPLAFAPKVIRMSDAGPETGEDPNSTPASARHKRGCNCKKSSCLKKYCECYQGGVGCSSNCRCESCKNTFGRRDGEHLTFVVSDTELTEEMKQEGEQTENCGKEKENDQQKANVQNEDHPLLELVPITPPFDLSSSLLKLPNFSSAKPPRPSKARSGNSRLSASKAATTLQSCKSSKVAGSDIDEEMPDILKEANSPNSCVKTTSPNGKRVSPPHNALSISPNRKGGRKLILKSIPSFPSLMGDSNSGSKMSNTDNTFSASPLALGKHCFCTCRQHMCYLEIDGSISFILLSTEPGPS